MRKIKIRNSGAKVKINKIDHKDASINRVPGNGSLIPVLFMGQSNLAVRDFPNTVVVPSGYAEAWKGTRFSGSVVDWPSLPDYLLANTSYLCFNEGTMVTNFVLRFRQAIGNKASIVKYAQASTTYGNWNIPPYNIAGNHWGAVLGAGQFPVYQSMVDTANLYCTAKSFTRASIQHVIMYLGESDAQRVGADSAKQAKSLADLYDLMDRVHVDFPNAYINIVETSHPGGQSDPGFVAIRNNQVTVSQNRNFVKIINNLTYLIPDSQSEDGLHLLPVANNIIAQQNVAKMLEIYF